MPAKAGIATLAGLAAARDQNLNPALGEREIEGQGWDRSLAFASSAFMTDPAERLTPTDPDDLSRGSGAR